ncbi:MAG: hypothetical protein Kow0075_15620 [Salibacteraceae bacterium]
MRNFCSLLILLILVFGACRQSQFDGYKVENDSLHIKWVELGDEDRPLAAESYVSVEMVMHDSNDRPNARKVIHRMPCGSLLNQKPLAGIFRGHFEGDSISVYVTRNHPLIAYINGQPSADWHRIGIRITEVLSPTELLQIRAEEKARMDMELKEQLLLAKTLDSLQLTDEHRVGNIWVKVLKKGNGKRVRTGYFVTVHYRGYFVDGRCFDDTHKEEPLQFESGRPDQVIDGFATGLAAISEGARALFVIPSYEAFGPRGSSSGIVSPYATLIYDVELVSVGY